MTYPDGTRLLAWRLEEDVPQLLELCRQQGIAVGDLDEMPVKRQREKAAERLLLCRALGRPVTLLHDRQGSPLVDGLAVNVSITHTMHLVALALNAGHVVGLDAEQTDRRQVLRVRDKFLNAGEQRFIAADDLRTHIIAWTAKEAVIKAERNSAIDWTEGIVLEPFAPTTAVTTFMARCSGKRYHLTSRPLQDHCITIAVPLMD